MDSPPSGPPAASAGEIISILPSVIRSELRPHESTMAVFERISVTPLLDSSVTP